MTIKNGQLANETNLNSAFVSKSSDSSMVGKLNLNSAEPESGAPVSNVQAEINTLKTFKAAAETTLTDHTLDIGILKGKANVIKEVPPTEEDDSSLGYGAGMIWYDSVADTYYFCISALEGAAVWKEIKTGGGGSGGINHITNSDFEEGAEGYSAYLNAPGVEPVTGTGGAPTVTIEPSEVSPLRGSVSGLFTKDAANRQGEGFSTDFTIDPADKSKPLLISFDYSTSENYKDGDIRVYIYDVTNSRIIEPSQRDLAASANHTYSAFFQASPDSVNYRLIWHVSSTSALSYNVKVDDIKVAPKGASVKGQVILRQSSTLSSSATLSNASVTGSLTTSSGSGVYSYDTSSGVYTVTRKAIFNLSMTLSNGTTTPIAAQISGLKDGVSFVSNDHTVGATGHWSSASLDIELSPGDTFQFRNATAANSTSQRVYVTATYVSDNVALSEDAGNRQIVFNVARSDIPYPGLGNPYIFTATATIDTAGGYNSSNGSYTIPETGDYLLSALVRTGHAGTTGQYFNSGFYRNGSIIAITTERVIAGTLSFGSQLTVVRRLNKGDIIDYRPNGTSVSGLTNPGGETSYFSVAKIQSPQTIAASEKVSVIANQASGVQSFPSNANTTMTFNTEILDTHGAFEPSTGIFTTPRSGYYTISAAVLSSALAWGAGNVFDMYITIAGVRNFVTRELIYTALTSSNVPHQGSASVYLNKGQQVYIRLFHNRTAGAMTLEPNGAYNWITIQSEGI